MGPLLLRLLAAGIVAAGGLWLGPFMGDSTLSSRLSMAGDLLTLSGILGSGVALVATMLSTLGTNSGLQLLDRVTLKHAILVSFALAALSAIIAMSFRGTADHYATNPNSVPLSADMWIFVATWSWLASLLLVFSVLTISLSKWTGHDSGR